MPSPMPELISGNEVPVPTNEGSCKPSRLQSKHVAHQTRKMSSAEKLQVRIVREGPCPGELGSDLTPAATAADGCLVRMTVNLGRVDVCLPIGAKYQCTVLSKDLHPVPLTFPDGAEKKIVPEEECRKHYIHFTRDTTNGVTKTWVCGICGKQCRQQFSLRRHLLTDHLSLRLFSCDQCSKTFKHKCGLMQHTQSAHSDRKPYVCDVCQKRYGRVSVLIQHRRIHTEKKAHVCHCGKAFHQKANLTTHQRVHQRRGEVPLQSRSRQPPLVYSCLACATRLESVDLLLQHKLTCQPMLKSLSSSFKAVPDTERMLETGKKQNMNRKLLSKIQSIMQRQEWLRRQQAAAAPPRLDPRRLRRMTAAPGVGRTKRSWIPSTELPPPPPLQRQQGTTQQQETAGQQETAVQPPAGRMPGLMTVPIRTRSMQLARQRNVQPFVLLQTDGEPPTLAKVLRTTDGQEVLVPATTDDLRQLYIRQDGHIHSDKLDLPVVALVTYFLDETGTPHVRVQPPSSERPDCTTLATSQIDLGPAPGVPPPSAAAPEDGPPGQRLTAVGVPSEAVGVSGRRSVPSATPAAAVMASEIRPQETGLSMPRGAELLPLASPARPPAAAAAADLSPATGDQVTATVPLPAVSGQPLAAEGPLSESSDQPPAGDTVLPAGDAVPPAGDAVPPETASIVVERANLLPDGASTLVEGGILLPEGTKILMEGSNFLPEGAKILAEGATLLPEGTKILIDGGQSLPERADFLTGGTSIVVEESNVLAEGGNVLAEGVSINLSTEVNLPSPGGNTVVQLVRQTEAGGLEPMSVEEAVRLLNCGAEHTSNTPYHNIPETYHQIPLGAQSPTVEAREVSGVVTQ